MLNLVCGDQVKPNVDIGTCYHQHRHCSRCSSSGCILCRFIGLRSWINSSFDDLPIALKPVIAICESWEKKYENTFNRICTRQDSSFMDIDDNSTSVQRKLVIILPQCNKQKTNC